jgi:hypothetical protein
MSTEENQVVENIEQTAPAAAVEGAPAPELNLNDLMSVKNLIDIVTARGVFKANELSSVGVLYDKLSTFLDAVAKQQAPANTGE